jgi:hypothetical protein
VQCHTSTSTIWDDRDRISLEQPLIRGPHGHRGQDLAAHRQGQPVEVVLSAPSIYLEKNYNSGGVVASETGKDARTGRWTSLMPPSWQTTRSLTRLLRPTLTARCVAR